MPGLSEKQMAHPRFQKANDAAQEAFQQALEDMGFADEDVRALDMETHAGRVVDDLTALLLRMERATT